MTTARSVITGDPGRRQPAGRRHDEPLAALLEPQPSVRLVADAHLAAIAIEHGLELCSRDRGFSRWAELGLRSRDPLV